MMALPNIPNFRQVTGTKLYRSSKLDSVQEDDIKLLQDLGIYTVVDLRSPEGFEDSTTASKYSAFDLLYTPFTVKPVRNYRTKKEPYVLKEIQPVKSQKTYTIVSTTFATSCPAIKSRVPKDPAPPVLQTNSTSVQQGRRLFLNVIDKEFALGLLRTKVPCYQIPWIVILMIAFLACRTQLFLKEFARIVMDPIGILGQYTNVIKFCGGPIYASLKLISEPSNVPSVICCAQGKDRTGIISALVMAICGASREEIVREYAATEDHFPNMSDDMRNYTASYYLKPEFGTAKAKTMEALLDYIDHKYGSIPEYLVSIGFTAEDQIELKQNVKL